MPVGKDRVRTAKLRRALVRWYDKNARPLPWREARDPYAIWVSEIMLQQTQVAAVIPYYRRFMRAFPTVHSLARARFETVARLWAGLGYYRRARNLQDAAREIVKRFDGNFPRSYEDARTLPGVGPYTACAVLSMAYQLPLPALDGNVARVIARLNGWHGNLQSAAFRRRVEELLEALLMRRRPGDFNQAMMELGQTVCLPRAPRCSSCPLRADCRAAQQGNPEKYPAPKARRPAEVTWLAAAIIRRRNLVGLLRGLDAGLLGDLWNFPAAFGLSTQEARANLEAKLRAAGSAASLGAEIGTLDHSITFRSIRVTLYHAAPGSIKGLRWFRITDLSDAPVSQLTRKCEPIIARCLEFG